MRHWEVMFRLTRGDEVKDMTHRQQVMLGLEWASEYQAIHEEAERSRALHAVPSEDFGDDDHETICTTPDGRSFCLGCFFNGDIWLHNPLIRRTSNRERGALAMGRCRPVLIAKPMRMEAQCDGPEELALIRFFRHTAYRSNETASLVVSDLWDGHQVRDRVQIQAKHMKKKVSRRPIPIVPSSSKPCCAGSCVCSNPGY